MHTYTHRNMHNLSTPNAFTPTSIRTNMHSHKPIMIITTTAIKKETDDDVSMLARNAGLI